MRAVTEQPRLPPELDALARHLDDARYEAEAWLMHAELDVAQPGDSVAARRFERARRALWRASSRVVQLMVETVAAAPSDEPQTEVP